MTRIITCPMGISNAFLLQGEKWVMVDTGVGADETAYRKLLTDHQIHPEEISLIIITHGHSDHFASLRALKNVTGAPVLCHREGADALRTGKNPPVTARNQLGKEILAMIAGNEPVMAGTVEPDILMDEIFDLKPYGISGKVVSIPGHSRCSVAVILDSREALVGDTLVEAFGTGKGALAYFADEPERLISSVQHLLKIADRFYSGHGGPFDRGEIEKALAEESMEG